MSKTSREFQVFAKPTGSICNLDCHYCYYLKKEKLYPEESSFRMSDEILEKYIIQHIDAYPGSIIRFSWHGGEPILLGLDYFENIVRIQNKYKPGNKQVLNGIQTNGYFLDEDWCSFLLEEDFSIGLSLDGPAEIHNKYRLTKGQNPTFDKVMQGYNLLKKFNIKFDILCVVNDFNVNYPLEVYRFFKEIGAEYISFLPLVERDKKVEQGVSERTVPAREFGKYLCAIFDEWRSEDIGKIKVQIFDEAAPPAFGQEHALCIFRETCGDIPVVEYNGDFYSCDHYVEEKYHPGNINQIPLADLLESSAQKEFGRAKLGTLPEYCRICEVRDMCNGGCPKNCFINTPDGEPGLNYLCEGYKKFFNHCRPFVNMLAELSDVPMPEEQPAATSVSIGSTAIKTGRNDPCPCRSGRKYKHCCLKK